MWPRRRPPWLRDWKMFAQALAGIIWLALLVALPLWAGVILMAFTAFGVGVYVGAVLEGSGIIKKITHNRRR